MIYIKTTYVFLLIAILCVLNLLTSDKWLVFLVSIETILLLVVVLFQMPRIKNLKKITVFSSSIFFGELLLFISLDNFRNLFPMVSINQVKAVGYSQYFGYQATFDYLFFFLVITIPFLVPTIILIINKYRNLYEKNQ